jgi:hypothetical protein
VTDHASHLEDVGTFVEKGGTLAIEDNNVHVGKAVPCLDVCLDERVHWSNDESWVKLNIFSSILSLFQSFGAEINGEKISSGFASTHGVGEKGMTHRGLGSFDYDGSIWEY